MKIVRQTNANQGAWESLCGVQADQVQNTQFINCQFAFDAAAQRTIAYLQNFSLMKKLDQIAPQPPQANPGVN